MNCWVGLCVIADNVVNIGRAMEKGQPLKPPPHHQAQPGRREWEKGDFTRIAESLRESGEALVKGLGITKGLKVLDLGCGDGTTVAAATGRPGIAPPNFENGRQAPGAGA